MEIPKTVAAISTAYSSGVAVYHNLGSSEPVQNIKLREAAHNTSSTEVRQLAQFLSNHQ